MSITGQRDESTLSHRKFEAARQPRTAIDRARLLAALAAAPDTRVVLLSAPAGSGKSVLLEQWVAGMRRPEWAWVSLDSADQDPVRFWSCVAEAIRRSGHDPAARTTAVLADGAVDPSVVATTAAADIAEAPGLRTLVLDDFHLAAGVQTEAGVAILAELLPPGVRLAIGTRSDPKLPLHRWRLRGELCELRASDLRFRDDEADRLFVGAHGLVLGAEDCGRLVAHTEGWAAGLQLAALSLRDGPDVPDLLGRFAATHQPLLDFLASEVLDRQPRWRRRFLQAAACVGEFCPAVLDVVLDRDDSNELLRDVRADNLFLVPLDHWPGWFRFHHLFGQFLRYDLHATDPGRELELRRRAGRWMADNSHPALAVDHLVEAGEYADALAVVDSRLITYYDRGRMATLRRWIERFPEDFLVEQADRCMMAATAWMASGDTARAARWLDRWQGFPSGGGPTVAARSHAIAGPTRLFLGDVDGCIASIEAAVRELEEQPWSPVVPSRIMPFAVRAHQLRGELAAAHAWLDRAAGHPGADPLALEVLVPGARAVLALGEGRLRAAGDLAAEVAAAEQRIEGARPYAVFGSLARASLLAEHGDLDAADAAADRVRLASIEIGSWTGVVDAYLVLAQVHQARDDVARALDDVDQARRLVRRYGMSALVVQRVDAAEAVARIAADDLDRAATLVARVPAGRRELLGARLGLAKGDDGAARSLLDGSAATWPLQLRIEREVVLACAAARSQPAEAERHIDRALGLAEPEGFRQTILAGGAGPDGARVVRDLVVGAFGRTRSAYVAELAHAAEPRRQRPPPSVATGPRVLVDPLTPAEQRVLFYLASSLTVAELARQLGVSANTVKTQMKGIYRKLEVGSRDAATERARELGLR